MEMSTKEIELITKQMDTASISIIMLRKEKKVQHIQENGRMISNKEQEKKFGPMDPHMLVIIMMVKSTARENSNGKTVPLMKASLMLIILKGLVRILGLIKELLLVIG